MCHTGEIAVTSIAPRPVVAATSELVTMAAAVARDASNAGIVELRSALLAENAPPGDPGERAAEGGHIFSACRGIRHGTAQ